MLEFPHSCWHGAAIQLIRSETFLSNVLFHLQHNPLLWQISQTLNGFRVTIDLQMIKYILHQHNRSQCRVAKIKYFHDSYMWWLTNRGGQKAIFNCNFFWEQYTINVLSISFNIAQENLPNNIILWPRSDWIALHRPWIGTCNKYRSIRKRFEQWDQYLRHRNTNR